MVLSILRCNLAFLLLKTTCLVFSVLSFLFSGCMRNRRRRRRRGAPLSVACLLAVGPVEGTFTYVTACRRLLHLVSSRSGFWRHVERSGKMRSDLSGVRKEESGQLATTVHVPTLPLNERHDIQHE